MQYKCYVKLLIVNYYNVKEHHHYRICCFFKKQFHFVDERQRACSLMAQAVELASKMPDLQNSLPHGLKFQFNFIVFSSSFLKKINLFLFKIIVFQIYYHRFQLPRRY